MPKPVFGPDDFENPDAPEGERRLRPDHWEVRDLSYEVSNSRREMDLWKGSLITEAMEPWEDYDDLGDIPDDAVPKPELRLFIKERPRGPGYVCDFVYRSKDLPVVVYGILINEGQGLAVCELEFWRGGWAEAWGYWDEWGDFVDADGWKESMRRRGKSDRTFHEELVESREHPVDPPPRLLVGITSDLLRRIPIGTIVARAQAELASRDWESEGIRLLPGPPIAGNELPDKIHAALSNASTLATPSRRGRPPLSDDLLKQVAEAYIREAPAGPGLTKRLAKRFDRPEATVKDWIKVARRRGYLSQAMPGRRGAAPGPRTQRGSNLKSS